MPAQRRAADPARKGDGKVDAFLAWLREEGAELNGVGVGVFPETARGVVALRDIHPGEVVVSIPDDLAFLVDHGIAAAGLKSWNLSNEGPSVPAHMQREALAIAVAAEILAGEQSRWAPYFVRLTICLRAQTRNLYSSSNLQAHRRPCSLQRARLCLLPP